MIKNYEAIDNYNELTAREPRESDAEWEEPSDSSDSEEESI